MSPEIVVELKGIVKRFGKVLANNNINLAIHKGEVHAIAGENGAGKSTLMKILYGLYHPDAGEIFLHGRPITRHSPKQAVQAGIGMVHQHFMLIPPLTVAENVMLGMESTKNGVFLDIDQVSAKIRELSTRFRLDIDPSHRVEDLSVGENQRVEILKVLYRGAEILILDEPTAVLTPGEVEQFFTIIKELVAQGKTVVIITHKLDEIMKISDRVTVIRQGQTIQTVNTADTSPEGIAEMMVGRHVQLTLQKPAANPGKPVLTVKDLTVARNPQIMALQDISFEVRAGEVFGIAGVEGNGQTELLEALMGLNREKIRKGQISLLERDITRWSVRNRLDNGMSHVPEDRHHRGLVLEYSIRDNLILGQHEDPRYFPNGILKEAPLEAHAHEMIKTFDIRPPHPEVAAGGLSGGNQQKIIIAREFQRKFEFLIAAQPTRGVDIGAIEFIHGQILKARSEGKAILLVSAELREILSLSDRIGVLYKGRIVKILDASSTQETELGMLMTGAAA
jgi:ABC-type uncharacterized transport system ATPase subunit